MAWSAKKEYLKNCSDAETAGRNKDIFNIVLGFSGILASLFAFSLLANNRVRMGLFIILPIMVLTGLVVQLCRILVVYYSYSLT